MAKQQQDRLKPGDRVEWNTSQGRIYLDARDPDSYSNVAWLFGQDDRPWGNGRFSARSGTCRLRSSSAKSTSTPMSKRLERSPARRNNGSR